MLNPDGAVVLLIDRVQYGARFLARFRSCDGSE